MIETDMVKKRVLFLANLTSGTGSIRQQFPEVLTILASHGCETLVYPIDPAAGLTSEKILSEAERHYDCILVAGGDGTLNHVINAMMHLDIHVPISYLPAGSANDFSKTLTGGKALSVQEIAESTAGSHVYAYDIGKFGDSYFNYIAAFGAFTNVSYETSQKSKNRFGYNAYVLETIANLQSGLSYRETMQIEHDGIIETGDYIFGAVCNTTSIGGMETPLLKDTKLDDGLFECLLIKAPNNLIDYNSIMADFFQESVCNSIPDQKRDLQASKPNCLDPGWRRWRIASGSCGLGSASGNEDSHSGRNSGILKNLMNDEEGSHDPAVFCSDCMHGSF